VNVKARRISPKDVSVPGGGAFVFEKGSTSDLISSVGADLCISNASACHSGQLQASPVQSALHIPAMDQDRFLRVGVGWWLSTDDIDIAVERISAAFEKQLAATGACHQ
jgi:cysteine desulfurase